MSPETSVADALKIMQARGFNQLPVLEGPEVLGVFSYRSLAQGLGKLPRHVKERTRDLLTLSVESFLEECRFAHVTDELVALFDEFDVKGTVLVGSQDRLLGVVTTIDALRYFYSVASPYVLLREIELAVRELIRASVDAVGLQECSNQSLRQHYHELGKAVPLALEDMTFHDYVMLLRFQGTWERFGAAFGRNQDMAAAKLAQLPSLRNDVFHFRRELTVEEYDTLRDCRDWLLKRIRTVEARRSKSRE